MTDDTPPLSVSALSAALKRTVEGSFAGIKLKGEISGYKRHSSGHAYFTLKDADAVIDAVMWKGVVSKVAFPLSDGLEVIAAGNVTTFPARSKYQIVVTGMEPAGAGTLLAQLEALKQRLTAEGLFNADRKRALPFLPQLIVVITSPTGAVIRDILHRLADRCPCRVLVIPVAVQGSGAAKEIAAALQRVNELPLPIDTVIVARGGGSLEDLLPFSDEAVVRAAAACRFPLISAVGHETDTTMIDYAADLRAPTPTAAAEAAVPVRVELLRGLVESEQRARNALRRIWLQSRERLRSLRLPQSGDEAFGLPQQKLDVLSDRLTTAIRMRTQSMRTPQNLSPQLLLTDLRRRNELLQSTAERLLSSGQRLIKQAEARLESPAVMLETLSYKATLRRGYALIKDKSGKTLTSVADVKKSGKIILKLKDGDAGALVE